MHADGRARGLMERVSERRCMPSLRHASPRRPRRGAQRSAGAVAIGRHRGMRRGEGARAQPRPTGRPLGRSDGGKHRADRRRERDRSRGPVPPFCVTLSTPGLWTGGGTGARARLTQFRPRFLRPLQLQRKVRYDGIHHPYFSAVSRHRRPSPPAAAAPPPSSAVSRSATGAPAAVGRRPRRIGTGPPPAPVRARRGPRAGRPSRPPHPSGPLADPSPTSGRSGPRTSPTPVLAVAVPRVLPGF